MKTVTVKIKKPAYEERKIGGQGSLTHAISAKNSDRVVGIACNEEAAEAFLAGWIAFLNRNRARGYEANRDEFEILEIYQED